MSTKIQLLFLANWILKVLTQAVIEVQPSNQTVNVRATVRMSCKVRDATDVYWEVRTDTYAHLYHILVQNSRQKTPSQFSYKITWDWDSHDSNQFDLIISSVDKHDQGFFICRAKGIRNRFSASKPAELKVQYTGDEKFWTTPTNVITMAGKNVRLHCAVNVNGVVTWLFTPFSGGQIKIGSKIKGYAFGAIWHEPKRFSWDPTLFWWFGMVQNSDLLISKVRKSDEGIYECLLMFDGSNFNRGVNLTVIGLPYQSHSRTELTLEDSKPVSLTCGSNSAARREKIAWVDQNFKLLIYDGLKLTTNPRINVDLFQRRKMLLTDVTYEDAQLYYCIDLTTYMPKWFEFLLHFTGCPPRQGDEDWKEVASLGKCYGTIKTEFKRFGDAEIWCRSKGGHLVMPKTDEEIRIILAVRYDLEYNNFWLGLTDFESEGLWRWMDGSVLSSEQSRWMPGKPNNYHDRDCAQMFGDGVWNDIDCGDRYHFICETPSSDWMRNKKLQEMRCPPGWVYFDCGGFCYKLSPGVDWNRAKLQCHDLHSKLAMPKTAREHRFVKNMVNQLDENREAWIGLTLSDYDTEHEWIDGTVETWILWGASRSRSGYTCLTINSDGRVNARLCSESKSFVCQKPQKMTPDLRASSSKCGETFLPSKQGGVNRIVRSPQPGINVGRILQGSTIDIEDIPWFVRLHIESDDEKYCSAVLISPRHVLTAAHCLTNDRDAIFTTSEIEVVLGSKYKDIRSGRIEPVHMIRIQDEFDQNRRNAMNVRETNELDIGILELKRAVQIDCVKIRAACLEIGYSFEPPYLGYDCIFAGLGGESPVLNYCRVLESDFTLMLWSIIGLRRTPTSCRLTSGDSGGPLLCKKQSQWSLGGIMFGHTAKVNAAVNHLKFLPLIASTIQSKYLN